MHHSSFVPTISRGYVLLLALVFLGIFFTSAAAYVNSVTSFARNARYGIASAQALSLAEAGVDQAIHQLNQDASYAGETNVMLGGGVYTVAVASVTLNIKRLTVTGYVPNATNPTAIKTVTALVGINTTIISFHYGAQVGAGGVTMSNGSRIQGNLFSGGSVSGNGIITGDVTVASGTPATSLSGITVNGTARVHTLSNCSIGRDAYYQTLSSCPVGGTQYPGSADAAMQSMPISEAQIAAWEAAAAAGGIIDGPYTINGSETLGPKEINGDLTVKGSLTLSGVVWVKGNINFENNATLTVSPATGNSGAIIIADVPGSEATSGTINLGNNVNVIGNGNSEGYPMLLSTNSGSSAIDVSNNVTSVILYASKGTVEISNNAEINQISAYRLLLKNNSTLTYLSGLQSQSFFGGAGGSWAVVPRTYSISR